MTSLKIYSGTNYLTIADLLKQDFRDIVKTRGQIYWNRDGQWRRIPNAILSQDLHVYDMWTKARPEKWTMKPPASVGLLFWDQGLDIEKWDLPTDDLKDEHPRVSDEADDGSH